ncbi:MAG: DCC1-like thiol-disulfide oxidoreductase family protein [Bacteroidia bacterium]|jgi:predicted DCC family thiol-disulfide oxidoreductase YuxK
MKPNSGSTQNQQIQDIGAILPEGKILVQFDGLCILCSKTVQFILKADRKKKFLFQTLQDTSKQESFDTVIVSDQNSSFQHFDAILKIGKELGGIYRMIAVFRILPRKWRLGLYLWIAKNRFRWFGIRNSCYLSSEDEKERFI